MPVDPERWRRLEAICQSALERPAAERADYVRQACGTDDALRQDAESLLDRASRADGFLSDRLGALAAAVAESSGGTAQPDEPADLVGQRIGPYELLATLGAGGMGVVYCAHDHSLGRSVAIKVLPQGLTADRERLARFEREARLLASLSHPNIAAIHGVERSASVTALVLELIDGETLEARLKRGPLSVSQSLEIGGQIAAALDHAHRRGVTHRDLKPANVMLTRHGVKLLDFGLAKWSERPPGFASSADATGPDGGATLTAEGTILGTLHYMAPEQLEGKAADSRADIFAFGAVLFEMLVGRRAFDGGSGPAIMAAVLHTEPPALETVQPLAPRSLDRVVRKCLAKDPDERWQSAFDLAETLRWIAAEATPAAVALHPDRPTTPINRRWQRIAVLAAVILVSTLAWFAGTRSGGPMAAVPLVTRFAVQPTIATNFDWFSVSPDGREIAFTGSQPFREPQLFVRRLDEFEETAVAGTEGAFFPFYSPNGEWIGMSIGTRLVKVQVRTGATPLTVCECADRQLSNGAAWLEDGSIVLSRQDRGLLRVSSDGGEPAELTTLPASGEEVDHHAPSSLPGGRALLFTSHSAAGTFDVEAVRLDTGERKVLVKAAYDARYLPSGHLVYARAGTLLAAPFDVDRLETTGPAVTLVERVADNPSGGSGRYFVSAEGTLAYRAAAAVDGRTLTWVTRTGVETPVPLAPRAFSSPKVSPDGTRLAFAVEAGGRRDVWTYELATQKLVRLTREGDNKTPVWSPDSRRLAYGSTRDGTPKIWVQLADGNGLPEIVQTGEDKTGEDIMIPAAWSSDGRALAYVHDNTSGRGSRSAVVEITGARQSRPLFPDQTRGVALSSDGRWVAFTAVDTRWVEVQVAAFPTPTTRHQISVGGGRQPLWRRDGRELVYRAGPRMFSVAVDLTGGFRSSAPVLLFERPYVVGDRDVMGLDYDLAPDGRFLMIKPSPAELRTNSVNVIANWIEEVKQRVPTTGR